MPVNLTGISCTAQPVLTAYEQTMFNVCEEYFYLNQKGVNRYPVLSQVRLSDVIDVAKKGSYINGVQFTAFSFDIVITDPISNPLFILEADGEEHLTDEERRTCDEVKDAIVAKAGIRLFRWQNRGVYPHVDVVRATADYFPIFSRDVTYPIGDGICFDWQSYPDSQRTIEAVDIELMLIESGWNFPPGWIYATGYDVREFHVSESP